MVKVYMGGGSDRVVCLNNEMDLRWFSSILREMNKDYRLVFVESRRIGND